MSRRIASCLLLAACNQALGLDRTHIPPPDAPPVCPPIGVAPRFSELVQQAVVQSCDNYTASASTGQAMAVCGSIFDSQDCLSLPIIAVGPSGGPLDKIDLPAGDPDDLIIGGPVMAPEGDEAYTYLYNRRTFATHLGAYARGSDGVWRWRENETFPIPIAPGVPSRRPHRHMLIAGNDSLIHELAQDDSGAWSEILPPYTHGELAQPASRIDLSPDGLRGIYTGFPDPTTPGLTTLYADRASIDQRFGAPTRLDAVPWTYGGPFLTEDCSRVLFSALDNILYVPAR